MKICLQEANISRMCCCRRKEEVKVNRSRSIHFGFRPCRNVSQSSLSQSAQVKRGEYQEFARLPSVYHIIADQSSSRHWWPRTPYLSMFLFWNRTYAGAMGRENSDYRCLHQKGIARQKSLKVNLQSNPSSAHPPSPQHSSTSASGP